MQTKKQISLTRKTLYGLILFGLFFSTFNMGSVLAAKIQEPKPTDLDLGEKPFANETAPEIFFDNLKKESPNGQYVILVSSSNLGMADSTIWIENLNTGVKKQLVMGGDNYWVTNPTWSPDGNSIAYLKVIEVETTQYESISRHEIWLINIDGTGDKLLANIPSLNPKLGYGGETDIIWNSEDEIEFDDSLVFPIQRYAINVNTLQMRLIGEMQALDVAAQSQPVNVPNFKQCDSGWGSNELGTGCGSTICSHGCAVTAVAIVFKYFGIDTDPGRLNTWLKNNSGYSSGCYMVWSTAANISSGISYIGNPGQDFNRLKSELDAGYPVIVEVNNNGQHFVVVTGYSGDTYYINDPAYTSRTTLASYGNSFIGMRIYHGPVGGGGSCSGPSLNSPSDGYVSTSQNVNFSWSGLSGCTFNGYTLRIRTDNNMDGSNPIYDQGVGETSRSVDIPSQYNNQDLYWGVKAANAPNGASWSTRRFRIQPGGTSSWNAKYFNGQDHWWDNNNFNNQMCEETINSGGLDKNYGSAAPCNNGITDNWVAEYNATINFGSGNYVFYAQNDDGLKIWVNGSNIMERGGSSGYYPRCPALNLSGNVPIRAILREEGGDARVKIAWSTDTSVCIPPVDFNKSSPSNGATGISTSPTLTWESSQYATSYHYCIDTSNNNNCDAGWQSVGTATNVTLSGLTAGTTYYWQARANSEGGEKFANNSSWWSFTTQPNVPTIPQNLRISSSTPYSITIAWDDVSNETGYKVYQWEGEQGFVYLATVGANQTTYTETRANCGWDEYYTVSAYNGNGESDQSDWEQGFTQSCPVGPTTPTIISPVENTVVVYPQNVVFDWSDSGDTYTFYFPGGPSATQYDTTTSTTTVNAPLAGFYEWFVVAHRNGQDSSPSAFTDLYVVPSAPQTVSVTTNSTSAVTVNWTTSLGGVDEYKIYRNDVYVETVNASTYSFQVTNLPCGDTSTYSVRAYKGLGSHNESPARSTTGSTSSCTSGDTYEPDDSSSQAKWIYSGTPQTHSIIPATDMDWMKFQLTSTSAVTLETTGAASSDTRMWLYDSNLAVIEYDDDDGTGNYSLINQTCDVNPLPVGTYFVKIDEFGNNDEISSYQISLNTTSCTPALPAAAVLTAPIDDIGTNYNPTYTWNKVSTATYYRLYVSGPSGMVLDQWYEAASVCNTTTCTVVSPTLGGGAHAWYVQAWNSAGYGPWSNNGQATNFSTTIPTPPAAAVLTAPIGNIGTNYNPTYTWNKVSTATYYRLYVSGPSGVVLDQWYEAANVCNTTTCTAASPTLGGGAYAWYVQTWNSAGYGPWSNNAQPTNFSTTIPPLPVAAVLTAPIGNIGTNYNPTYTWNKVSTATYYRLYVSGPSGVVLDQWYEAANVCNTTTCTAASPTLGGGAYAWYVQTWNSAGYGPWSNNGQATNFSTTIPPLPAAVVLTAPIGNIGTNYNPTYTWNKVSTATWYRLYVSGPSGVVLDQWYEAANTCNTTTCTVASPTLGGGTFSWYVQTYNSTGFGPWSNNAQSTNFTTTIPTPPAATVLTAPIGDIGTNHNPTYTWNRVSMATYYRLYVSGPSGVVLDQWYQASIVCNTTTCSVASPTLGVGAHSWYVQSWNAAGYGPWSNNAQPTNFATR